MKLISWNVNGIRAAVKKGFEEFFEESNADIFAIQETKAQVDQIALDFPTYHAYYNSAVKKDIVEWQSLQKKNHYLFLMAWG